VPVGNVLRKVLWRYQERRLEFSDIGKLFISDNAIPSWTTDKPPGSYPTATSACSQAYGSILSN